ncbi:MAG: hypothetical protein GY696_21200 [Gammaproteobacteria bacterium]|nr:hypothetical protein [Gammaproteobacteria bacterium]
MAISADLARELGVKISPSRLKVTTAAHGSPLEVVGTVASLVMAVSPTNLLRLTDVVIYRNLGHQLNLGLNFCRQFKARLDYEGDRPCIQIQGERYSLVNSAAVEERGGEREQPRDLEQAQHGQKPMRSNNKQMSTFGRQFRELGIKLAPAVSITNMFNSVQSGELCDPKEREIPTAAAQPEKILGPGKSEPSKLRQDEVV